MRTIWILLIIGVFISGCAAPANECVKNRIMQVKEYSLSTIESKNKLSQDLRIGKIGLGEGLAQIRTSYGDADDIFVSGCIVRLTYKIGAGKNITLWFEDGEHLTMWSN